MKKLSVISMAALMLASCSSDDMQGPAGAGSEQEVTLSFQLPTEIGSRAQGGNDSSKGGATNCTGEVTFTVELSYGNTVVFSESKSTAIPNANASVTFRPTLILGENYNLVAYAQFDGAVTDLTAIEENGSINDETVDAYYISAIAQAAPQMSATLKRHTGKLRIIADDFAEWQRQTGKTIKTVKVAYKQAQATKFNAETGVWDAATAQTKEFTADWTTYTNEAGEKTIMVDYIPASATGEIINIESVTVTTTDNWTFTKALATLDVPVKRNYLTTLKGNFFTSGTELKIEIDDAFEGEENVNYELVSAFENGGIVTLTENVTLDEPLVAKAGKNVVLNLDGATITNKVDNSATDVILVEEGATLTINGNGKIEAVSGNDGYAVIANGKLIINGGTFSSGIDANNEGNATIYARGNGEIYIYGGDFANTNDKSTFVINKKDADRATTKILIYGGTFHNFNPANNAAEGPATNFVADGYDVVVNSDVYTVVEGTVAASAAELAAAVAAGGKVILNESLELTSNDAITIAEGQNVELNLNGKTLTVAACNFVNNGTATISNGIVSGAATQAGRRAIINSETGSMTLSNITIKQIYEGGGSAINNSGKMIVEEGTIVEAENMAISNKNGAEMTINGGSFIGNGKGGSYAVVNQLGSTMTINGGTFEGGHGCIATSEKSVTTLNAGSFHCSATYTGNSDWTLYAEDATIIYDEANCTITSANPNGAIYDKLGTITKK